MFAIVIESKVYAAFAVGVLLIHVLFVVWVLAGTLLTRLRPILRRLHIASLVWGICAEVLPGVCPLTSLENWLESRAGVQPYQGGFLLHYLDALVYPDISGTLLMTAGVAACLLNLGVYARRFWNARREQANLSG
jgi:hypothetical protein